MFKPKIKIFYVYLCKTLDILEKACIIRIRVKNDCVSSNVMTDITITNI